MSLTRGNVLDDIVAVLGDTSSKFRNHLASSLNKELFKLWDRHDWEFKHKSTSFTTAIGVESYTIAADCHSSTSLEVMYDVTNGNTIDKTDLKVIRKAYPKEDITGMPLSYAPWGDRTIILSDKPDGIYTIKYLYTAKPTLPTTDLDDLESVCGLPDYVQPILYEMVLSKGLFYIDDSRYTAHRTEIENLLIPRAIQADMQHLESSARFKFFDEEAIGDSFQDRFNPLGWGENY